MTRALPTALIIAAQEGHTDIARVLVVAGAEARVENEYGNSPLTLARGYGHRDIVTILESQPQAPGPLLAQAF